MDIPASPANKRSYTQILKSTALIGGSSVINVGFSIIRNKAMALLLGPEGIGLMGLYMSTADIAQTIAGMGVNPSGVRQIAAATGSNDAEQIARTAMVLRRVSVLLGLVGALLLFIFAAPIGRFTFGDTKHTAGMMLLSLAIFFQIIAGGQSALIQGMREISSLARMNVLGAFYSTVISIPLIYFFGADGVVASLVAVAAAMFVTSWWYSRNIRIRSVPLSLRQFRTETVSLLRLGLIFMISGVLTFGSAYAIRIIVLNENGFHAAGLYQAAWALGGLYAGFVLQAMGTDFYPRLTAVANDDDECNRLINEQTQVSILLAGPGLLATLTLAPLVLRIFYSPEFYAATDLLRWICLGMMLRIVAWPIGFIVLAKGAEKIFFWTEVAATVVHVGLAWLLVKNFGTVGAGAAFFGLYAWHSILIYWIARRMSGFRWSADNRRLVMIFLPLAGVVYAAFQFLPFWQAIALGCVATMATGLFSLRMLVTLIPPENLPAPIRSMVARFV
ncbi:O-antigen translocase [Rhizobiaceae bacterium n13]|uniref:O-antigen translocase n=1 Tax=Ferirhizobium litorale TaxID=2927786 RepID=A0AAE3TZD5_9HYPH|nr:O-antigen translocase [Fererhizobium litorale]MDI7860726.1 O-antigen translocase [Fererhizobium litorale]MDI7920874.1 O-antigen translocase [Fererhizobium litorale]